MYNVVLQHSHASKNADGMTNSADTDWIGLGAIWSGSTLFAQTHLSENFGSLQYFDSKNNLSPSWQNQQNDCGPSEDSDQPRHPPSLINVFAVHSVGS